VKLAIDSYCYHRYFGEWYPGLQREPGRRMTVWDFLQRAHDYKVDGVSLECCFFTQFDDDFIAQLRDALDRYGLERIWAWGHPNGLGSGTSVEAAEDLVRHLAIARRLGATTMRICGGGRRTRPESWPAHKAKLAPMLNGLVDAAERHGVVLAIENHLDLLADEMVELISTINSPWLGVCLDTGNNLRLFEDPLSVVKKLAPFARATHIKDLGAQRGKDPKDFAFWPSVPLGEGLVDMPAVIALLRGAGYGGLLALEIDYLHPAFGEDEEPAIARSLDYLRSLLVSAGGDIAL
jgi:3-oxoisoapionate decarboxylase